MNAGDPFSGFDAGLSGAGFAGGFQTHQQQMPAFGQYQQPAPQYQAPYQQPQPSYQQPSSQYQPPQQTTQAAKPQDNLLFSDLQGYSQKMNNFQTNVPAQQQQQQWQDPFAGQSVAPPQ
jgi:hypothetical protein